MARKVLLRRGILAAIMLGVAGAAQAQDRSTATVDAAQVVLREFTAIGEQRIPESLLRDAQGIAIVPNVIKVGFVAGLRHGRGVVMIRDRQGNWQLPSMIELTGGSVGWQAGAQSTDVILVFRSSRGLDNLLRGTFTLGADAAVAAGPVGRQAQAATDAQLTAEILSYSRSRGLFAGVALDGSVLRPDYSANALYYGSDPAGNATRVPEAAVQLTSLLAQVTGGGTVPPPAYAAAPMPPAAPLVPPDRTQAELAAASKSLMLALDENWQRFLALPAEVYGPTAPDARAVQATAARYDQVAADPRYQALVQRREFQDTYRLLKAYAASLVPGNPLPINLPPPPTSNPAR